MVDSPEGGGVHVEPEPLAEAAAGTRPEAGPAAAITQQIRGSSMLFAGQALALAATFVYQVLMVRYLSKGGYGAFAYSLALVSLLQTVSTFGLNRTTARFVSIAEERGDHERALGTIVVAAGTVVGVGASLVLVVLGLQGLVSDWLIGDRTAVVVLLILVALAPMQALDDLSVALFAVFGRVRSIFVRTYVLTPALRLAVVIALIASGAGVRFLAAGFVAAGALGLAIYAGVVVRTLRLEGLLARAHLDLRRLPLREVLSLSAPLFAADLAYALIASSDAILLGHFRGTREVASFKAVQPAARLNEIVFTTFAVLFTPLAARLYARRDQRAISDLYWQTAAWIAVVSFPMLALTFAFAGQLTPLVFGSRYGGSATFLTILAVGYYAQGAFGFNGTTIMVYGRVGYILALSGLAVTVNLSLNLLLIPRYGALGAAIGTATTLCAHNVFKQIGLWLASRVPPFDRHYTRVYATVVGAAAALFGLEHVLSVGAAGAFGLSALATAIVFWISRDRLRVGDTFPELLTVPLGRRLFGKP